jgi:hypothetical protein
MGLIAINTPVTTYAASGDLKQKLKPRCRYLKRAFGRLTAVAFVTTALSTASTGAFAKGDADKPAEVIVQSTQTIVEYRYVGLTDYEDAGTFRFGNLEGVGAMNKACADTFGAGARAATIAEAFYYEGDLSRQGWLVPGSSPIVVYANSVGYNAVDAATGITVGPTRSSQDQSLLRSYCNQYHVSSFGGAPVIVFTRDSGTKYGGVDYTEECGEERPAACSAPVSIPVRQ